MSKLQIAVDKEEFVEPPPKSAPPAFTDQPLQFKCVFFVAKEDKKYHLLFTIFRTIAEENETLIKNETVDSFNLSSTESLHELQQLSRRRTVTILGS